MSISFKDFIKAVAQENEVDEDIVSKIFEESVRIAATRYYSEDLAASLKYELQTGNILDKSGNIIDIRKTFNLGGINLLKNHFLKEIKRVAIDREIKSLNDSKSKLIIGRVKGKDRNRVFFSYKSFEIILPKEEQVMTEEYNVGEIYKMVILKAEKTKDDYAIIVSRRNDNLLLELLKSEIPELQENKISIVALVREPGYRSKVVVKPNIKDMDVLGMCVGLGNTRISNVSRELHGERIDIIEWKQNLKEFIRATLKPAEIKNIDIFEREKEAVVEVKEEDIPKVLGKNGQNIRLASRLCNYYIKVKKL